MRKLYNGGFQARGVNGGKRVLRPDGVQSALATAAPLRAQLAALRARDFSYESGRILGSMCTTPHPLALDVCRDFQSANLGDPGHFPGSKDVEDRYLAGLHDLAGSPGLGAGQVTSGGSEANILALALMREQTGKDEVIVPRTGHFSFEKAAKFLRLRLRIAEVDDAYRVLPESVETLIGPRTAGIIAIAGSTQVGSVDPIREVAAVAHSHDLPLHVDAAFGGYVLPFLKPARRFGLDLPGVTSVTMDSHKMGMGVMGVGAILVRRLEDLEPLSVETPYLSTPRHRGVLGTRSAGPVAAAWALWARLGRNGYAAVVERCMKTTQRLARALREKGISPLLTPELNIVAIPTPHPYDVQDALTTLGWRVNVLPRLGALRIVCMPHVTPASVDGFVKALSKVVAPTRAPRARRLVVKEA